MCFTVDIVSASVDVVVGLPLRHDLEGLDKNNGNKEQDQQHRGNNSSQGSVRVGYKTPE